MRMTLKLKLKCGDIIRNFNKNQNPEFEKNGGGD